MLKAFAAAAVLALLTASGAATSPRLVPVGEPTDFSIQNWDLVIYCEDCMESDKPVIYATFALQKRAYECLAHYFQFRLGFNHDAGHANLVYKFTPLPRPIKERYADSAGWVNGLTVHSEGFFGRIWQGSDRVTRVEDVRLDLHETTHVFVHSVLKPPQWFNEGMAIMLEERLSCHPQQARETRFSEGQSKWRRIKSHGSRLPEKWSSPHDKGAIFMAALNDDYGCDLYCVRSIFNHLQQQPGKKVSTKDVKKAVEWRLGQLYGKESIDYLFKTLDLD